ncbi:hypothetical protein G3I19_01905 [Streptomyces sp. SID10853]|uniref:hypothetical protein n=1 Tax=Streptomyces sp. SID10853 TaxID=2706028 RepID=UPI0013BF6F5F|nr:hypothetical protein [Streptomyces sp. SID10853]NDZ77297.1 hypothetical protein [Streptomyces sp. SID10853]
MPVIVIKAIITMWADTMERIAGLAGPLSPSAQHVAQWRGLLPFAGTGIVDLGARQEEGVGPQPHRDGREGQTETDGREREKRQAVRC